MTGPADTEAEEFGKIYDLDVTLIPTNRPMLRDDEADVVLLSALEEARSRLSDETRAVQIVLEELSKMYTSWGRPELGVKYEQIGRNTSSYRQENTSR